MFQQDVPLLIGSNITVEDNIFNGNCTCAANRGDIEIDALDSKIIRNYLSNPRTAGAAIRTNYGSGIIYENKIYGYEALTGVDIAAGWQAWDNQGSGIINKTKNVGTLIANGTGTQTDFDITHNLATDPVTLELTAKHSNAVGDKYWVKKDTNTTTIKFITPPPVGTNNVILSWRAEA